MSGPLADKVVLIVGGTTGLGRSAAAACVSAGARVVVVGRNPDRAAAAVEALGASARAVTGDAADPQTSDQAVRAAVDAFGDLHGLFHVAGGSGRRLGDGPLDQIDDAGWSETLHWNLDSLFYSNRAAIRFWRKREQAGAILNMGSVLARHPAPRFFATHAYAAAKAAIEGLSRAAAAYYAPHGIRINVVAPGLIETPMSERACRDAKITHYARSRQPLEGGRVGQPEDLDAAVVYLLSDQSRFVTGQVLQVDGGWSVSDGEAIDSE